VDGWPTKEKERAMRTYDEIMDRLTAAPHRLEQLVCGEVTAPGDGCEGLRQLGRFYQVVSRVAGWNDDGSFGFRFPIAISRSVDPYWHAHLLYTSHYREFCDWLVPRPAELPDGPDQQFFLDHWPLAVDPLPVEQVEAAYEETRRQMRIVTGGEPSSTWWPAPSRRNVVAYACTGRRFR
jgi:hypothetical protein